MANAEDIFKIIWEMAIKNGYDDIEKYKEKEVWPNGWGSIFISLEGDFGQWLKKHLKTRKRKEVEYDIPHFFLDAQYDFARAFESTLRKFGIETRHDIRGN